jgi:lipopolysaccharide transport system ATP-binding protein
MSDQRSPQIQRPPSLQRDGSETDGPIVRARGLTKRYPLFSTPTQRLAQALLGPRIVRTPEFTALEDVSFDLKSGDALAILGRNGAGKSTLLQILAGIIKPTRGIVAVPPRTAGLLELGSGFNPEFTGRENVFLNATILGLSRDKIEERLDDILEFAEIDEFIDRPVKTYSTGMFLRLAFSVAINVEPRLLLVDEALTVGDVFFQQKCYQRLELLRERGMSVLLVTHSTIDAAEFCNRGIVLSHGRIVFDGSGREAVEHYLHHEHGDSVSRKSNSSAPQIATGECAQNELEKGWTAREGTLDLSRRSQIGLSAVRATHLRLTDERGNATRTFQQGDSLRILAEFESHVPLNVPLFGVELVNSKGIMVHGRNSLQFDSGVPDSMPADSRIQFEQLMELNLDVGEYTIEIGFADMDQGTFALRSRLLPADVFAGIRRLCHVPQTAAITVCHASQGYPCRFSHFGVADLPGEQRAHLILSGVSVATPSPGESQALR